MLFLYKAFWLNDRILTKNINHNPRQCPMFTDAPGGGMPTKRMFHR